jgi:hypothetical protein
MKLLKDYNVGDALEKPEGVYRLKTAIIENKLPGYSVHIQWTFTAYAGNISGTITCHESLSDITTLRLALDLVEPQADDIGIDLTGTDKMVISTNQAILKKAIKAQQAEEEEAKNWIDPDVI